MVFAAVSEAPRNMRAHAKKIYRPKKTYEPPARSSYADPQTLLLKTPPGLGADDDEVAPPPGLENVPKRSSVVGDAKIASSAALQSSSAVAEVRIRGLPKPLTTDIMVEAILEQANLESEVVGHVTTAEEVVVSFASESAAKQCVSHFAGCSWDASGAVRCEIIPLKRKPVLEKKPEVVLERKPLGEPVRIPVAPWLLSKEVPLFDPIIIPVKKEKSFSADAPVFVPGLPAKKEKGFSADAPVFVPSVGVQHDELKKAHTPTTVARSEVSTDEDTNHCVSEDEAAPQVGECR